MAKTLSTEIVNQITKRDIKAEFIFKIGSVDYTSYLKGWSLNQSYDYSAASATFTLVDDGRFNDGGSAEINLGDVVEFIERYKSGGIDFKKFYGFVSNRTIVKGGEERVITLTCLDYVSKLKYYDVNYKIEGTKIHVLEETLTANPLPSPQQDFSQVYNFANDSIAENPAPILIFKNIDNNDEDVANDSFEIQYSSGQVKLGLPINTQNFSLIARSYYHYTEGVYVEDIIEDLLTEPDGYSEYLFGETTAGNVISNHLTETFLNVEETSIDSLVPNYTDSEITLNATLTVAYDPTLSSGVPTIVEVNDTSMFPTSGSGTINGDTFTWTGKTATTLTGVPTSGGNALKYHSVGALVKYTATYTPGTVWYLSYSNVQTDLVAGNFTIPGGTFKYLDKRFGRIILNSAIATSAAVTCNVNYTFKTIQATGVQINGIEFRPREVENRYAAIEKLLTYLDPNYKLRTVGDNKIWAKYLTQKYTADYNLTLVKNINYMDSDEIYTRVKFFSKNINPTNIMFDENVDFVTTGQSYKGLATNATLTYTSTDDIAITSNSSSSAVDNSGTSEVTTVQNSGTFHNFLSSLTNAGYISVENFVPIVYINGIRVDNKSHLVSLIEVEGELTTKTITTVKSNIKGTKTEVSTYYTYKFYFPHQSIDPSAPIILYNATGTVVKTISPNDPNVDYARGIWSAPGSERNADLETVSTATYYIYYGNDAVVIDYDNIIFRIRDSVLPKPSEAVVTATFEYWTVLTPRDGIAQVIDGRYDTQVQTEFYAEPPADYPYAIIDLGASKHVQAFDIVGGFFKPDEYRKIDTTMKFSLKYSNTTTAEEDFNYISDRTRSFEVQSGEVVSFEEDALGTDLECRYLMLVIENIEEIDYKTGCWPVCITEIAAYCDIILETDAKLIPTTKLATSFVHTDTTMYVNSTKGFDDPDSAGGWVTAYIWNGFSYYTFKYTGKTATSFTGVSDISQDIVSGARVASALETDSTLYDDFELLSKLGDKMYKKSLIDDNVLFTQERSDKLGKAYLKELVKNHTQLSINLVYQPHFDIGQTIAVTDSFNNHSSINYFVQSINDTGENLNVTLARYPGDY